MEVPGHFTFAASGAASMSEYQYYEFAAIDRPLTRAETARLRAVSMRAIITPVSFTNVYEWGDLKADPADWMQRYFDAFVYTANWCSRELVEFLEVDADLLEAARAGSAMTPSAGGSERRRITAWLDTWHTQDMKDVLRRIALGHGPEAERRVKSHYADWLKAQCSSSSANAPRRRVAELRELANRLPRSGRNAKPRRVRSGKPRSIRPQVAALAGFPCQTHGSDAPPG